MIPVKFPLDVFLPFHHTSLSQHFPPAVTYIVKLNVRSVFIGWLSIITIETLRQKPLHYFSGMHKDSLEWIKLSNEETYSKSTHPVESVNSLIPDTGPSFSKSDKVQVWINLLTKTCMREKCPEAWRQQRPSVWPTEEHIHQNAPLYNNVSTRAAFALPSEACERFESVRCTLTTTYGTDEVRKRSIPRSYLNSGGCVWVNSWNNHSRTSHSGRRASCTISLLPHLFFLLWLLWQAGRETEFWKLTNLERRAWRERAVTHPSQSWWLCARLWLVSLQSSRRRKRVCARMVAAGFGYFKVAVFYTWRNR